MKPYDRALRERLPREKDKRYKYTEIDKADVLARVKNGATLASVSRDTGISKRTIQFWLYPERLKRMMKHYKARGQSRTSYLKMRGEKWNALMRSIRKKHIELYGKKYGVQSKITNQKKPHDPSIQSV